MKKILMLAGLLAICISTSGCNQYITTEITSEDGDVYYGAYNRRDMIHADVKLFQKGTDRECDGVIFLNAPSRSITFKNDRVDATMIVGCNDKTIIKSVWQLKKRSFNDGWGEGVDQFNKIYQFKTISRKEFKEIASSQNIEFAKENESYLKY